MKYLLPLALGLAIGSTAMLALAQTEVTASVPLTLANLQTTFPLSELNACVL